MDSTTWSFIQSALLYVYQPIILFWLAGVVFLSVLVPLYNLMLGFFRWLSGKGTLI